MALFWQQGQGSYQPWPWWVNRAENAILLTSFVPFLLILFFMWLAKIILVRQNMT